jgi:hypothetical protein
MLAAERYEHAPRPWSTCRIAAACASGTQAAGGNRAPRRRKGSDAEADFRRAAPAAANR